MAKNFYIGIDLGGTFIKGGIVDSLGNILLQDKVPTEREKGDKAVAINISNLCLSLLERANLTTSDIVGIGVGVPGMIDSAKGEVVYSNNLEWEHFFIAKEIEKQTGIINNTNKARDTLLINQFLAIKTKYGDARRTAINSVKENLENRKEKQRWKF